MLEFCKWDPQVGDVSTLAPFPVFIAPSEWRHLANAAEQLTAETLQLESRLRGRPDLHAELGLSGSLRGALRQMPAGEASAADLRVMRFDFHPTTDGWRVSEVNSDVPGGYAEASAFTTLVSSHVPGSRPPGDPAAAVVDALTARAQSGLPVALLSAAGFMEDHQVVAHLARRLRARGVPATLASPGQLRFRDDAAWLDSVWHTGPLSALVRFYQAEWLPRLPRSANWPGLFGTTTPTLNPPCAVLTESKRLPLLWDRLGLDLPAWRRYLPESRDPRDAPWRKDDGWLLKTAFCNTGDTVTVRERTPRRRWLSACLDVTLRPGQWVAQRRFAPLSIATPVGPMYPCVGVYTVAGRSCGAYTRLSPHFVIDYAAVDAALLVETDDLPETGR